MVIYLYSHSIYDRDKWFLSEVFGTIRHMCPTYDAGPWESFDSESPCPHCWEKCPDMLILAAKIGTFPMHHRVEE